MAPVGSFGMSKEQLVSAALKVYWDEFNKTSSCSKDPLRPCGALDVQAQNFWKELNKNTCGEACPLQQQNNCGAVDMQTLCRPPMSMQASIQRPTEGSSLVVVCAGTMESGICAYKEVRSLSRCQIPPSGDVPAPMEVQLSKQKATSITGIRQSPISADVGSLACPSLNHMACGCPMPTMTTTDACCGGSTMKESKLSVKNAKCGESTQHLTTPDACCGESMEPTDICGALPTAAPSCGRSKRNVGSICGGGASIKSTTAPGGSRLGPSIRVSEVDEACKTESCMTAPASELFPVVEGEEFPIEGEERPMKGKAGPMEGMASKEAKYADFGRWGGSPCSKNDCGNC